MTESWLEEGKCRVGEWIPIPAPTEPEAEQKRPVQYGVITKVTAHSLTVTFG